MTVDDIIREAEFAKIVQTEVGPAILLGSEVITVKGSAGTDWTATLHEALRDLGEAYSTLVTSVPASASGQAAAQLGVASTGPFNDGQFIRTSAKYDVENAAQLNVEAPKGVRVTGSASLSKRPESWDTEADL